MRDDRGFLTVQYVTVVALSLVLLTVVVNAIAFQYARGVIATAMADGARAGARAGGSDEACRSAAKGVIEDLLSPAMAQNVRVTCTRRATGAEARADVTLSPWLPLLPAWSFAEIAVAPVEPTP